MSESLPWNLCVVSHFPDLPHCAELANALLYGDKTLWLPAELAHLLPTYFTAFGLKVKADLKLTSSPYVRGRTSAELARRREGYDQLLGEIKSAALDVEVPLSFTPQLALRHLGENVERLVPRRESKPGSVEALLEPLLRGIFGSMKYSASVLAVLQALDEQRPDEVWRRIDENNVQGCIIERGSPYALQPFSDWNAHRAAQVLMNGLSRLLLPDASRLPLPAIGELKVEIKDYLDPMRADMLRLTKQLRAMVEGQYAQEDVAREAVNLIATEVEPVVRELAKYTEDVMRSRWRKILQGTLNVIGISGLGFLNPAAFAKDAAMSGVKFITELPDVIGKVQPPTHAARFVLEVQQRLSSTQRS